MLWLYIWLGVVAITLVLEFITMDLICIWMSVGAFIAMILAGIGVGLEFQIITFIVVSVGCILGLRKITLKLLHKNKDKTNLDLIIGQKTKLLTDIKLNEMGTLKHNGIVYFCKTENNEEITAGEVVVIDKFEGNKLIVRKEEK